MKHFWQDIPGYFTFPAFYAWVAQNVQGKHFVEVGVYTGQSAAFLCVELVNAQRYDVRLDLVDLEMTKHGAVKNLEPVAEYIGQVHEMLSVEASKRYADASLDFVFIDADHSYAAVARDIDAWRPKVKPGGWLSGHDFCQWVGFGVIEAVTERFPRIEVWSGSKGMGDTQMQPRTWPCWAVQL
jgi:SAM-dependent methyltransferase